MNKTSSRRRWIQFSLKGLLIATAILSLWLGRIVSQVHNQAVVVAEVQDAGGSVWFETDQCKFVDHWLTPDRIPSTAPAGPGWLRQAVGEEYFRNVVQIDFTAAPTNDVRPQDLIQLAPRLRKLPLLETIRLELGDAGDDTLVKIIESSNLTRLKNLYVGSLVTDRGIKHISELSGLETLNLRYTEVTDDGASHLANLRHLHSLFLYSAKLTEQGIPTILALPNLKKLILYDCAITEEQLASLAQHHPNVDASVYFTSHRGVAK
jgi:hypothetical protein